MCSLHKEASGLIRWM